jgi:hypothetical protein
MRARPPSAVRRPRTAAAAARRAPLDGLFRGATEHGRLEREQDTLRLIRLGVLNWEVPLVRRQGLEPRTVALRVLVRRFSDLLR